MRILAAVFLVLAIAACQSHSTLYQQLGGADGVDSLVTRFMERIGNDPRIAARFADTDPARFHRLLSAQICSISNGGCVYDGDSMAQVHAGMNIRPAEFNALVEDLVSAMNDEGLPQTVQNQLLARLAPMQGDIVGH